MPEAAATIAKPRRGARRKSPPSTRWNTPVVNPVLNPNARLPANVVRLPVPARLQDEAGMLLLLALASVLDDEQRQRARVLLSLAGRIKGRVAEHGYARGLIELPR